MFRLYYAPGTCALATHIALEVPRVMAHRRRMLAPPAVQEAVAAEGTQIA